MVTRRKIVRRSKPVVEEVEDVDLEDEVEVEEDAESDDEEDEEPAPRGKVTKKVVIPPATAKVVKAAKKAVVVEDEDDDDEAPVEKKSIKIKTANENLIQDLINELAEGKSLLITILGQGKLQVVSQEFVAPKATSSSGLSGKEFWDTVADPGFIEWNSEWKKLTFDEKKAAAKKAGAKWEPHEDEGIEHMRLSSAMRDALGIEKYKPEYRTREQRAALRNS